MIEDISITFEPHIKTLTESGRSHFLRPVDAIAEYIDNSIQACSNNDVSRNINISLFLASRAQTLPSFLVLLDDGMGMNVQTIKEFATYSLDQESRYKMPRENETSFIGKFGVGAKQAGFYLGSRIKLFSKPKDSFLESAVVYSFCLDGEELQSRYEQQQVIYEGNVHCSPVSNDIELSGDEAVYNQMEELIQNHLRSVLHGSAFIIKLRPEIIKKLSEMDEGMLATEIKEIYHFHIHPENSFHVGVKGNTTGSRSRLPIAETVLSPLNMTYDLYYGNSGDKKYRCNLHDITDFIQKCTQRCCDTFKFTMEASLLETVVETQRVLSQLSQVNSTKKVRVEGFLMYFPYRNGMESRPDHDILNEIIEESEVETTIRESTDCIIRIYWQNRLVPESHLQELPFFPPLAISNRSDITRNWRARVVGCIFFDWQFNLIANNKLKLLIDLNSWLNNKSISKSILYYPKNCLGEFLGWLETCHKEDREYVFSDRDYNTPDRSISVFKTLTFRHQNKIIISGEKIKFKGPNKSSPIVYAEVIDFIVAKSLSDFESYYFGSGQLRFKRLPLELFGSKIEQEGITSINGDDFSVKTNELTALRKEIPLSVNVYLFEKAGDKGVLMNNGDRELILGAKYFKIGIQILNGDKKPICCLPDSGNDKKSIRFSVQVQSSDGKDYGKTNDLWKYDAEQGIEEQVAVVQKRDLKYSYYGVYNIVMDRPGEKSFTVVVLAPAGHSICETVIPFHVLALQAERIEILDTLECRLGQPFPHFTVKFYDCMNNEVPFEGDVKLELCSDEMQVLPNGTKEYIRKVKGGELTCMQGDWVAIPKPDSILFDGERCLDVKDVKFRVRVIGSLLDTRGKSKFSDPIGDSIEITVKYFPGAPTKMILLEPRLQPIKVIEGSTIPFLHFAITDFWGNRVAPLDNEDWEILFTEGPITIKEKTVVTKTGEALCYNLSIDGCAPKQYINLAVGNQPSNCEMELDLEFLSTEKPTSIQILQNEKPLSARITCRAGETLENLSFEILDEKGGIYDVSLRKIGKKSWMECEWALQSRNKSKRVPIPSDLRLPDLHIPTDVAMSPYDANLEIVIDGQILEMRIEILITPADPSQWKLVGMDIGGPINMAGDYRDFAKYVHGTCLVDEFGNVVSHATINSSLNVFLKGAKLAEYDDDMVIEDVTTARNEILTIQLIRGQIQLQNEIEPKSKKRKKEAANLLLLTAMDGFCLPIKYDSFPSMEIGSQLGVYICDELGKYQPSEFLIAKITKSFPRLVRLSSVLFEVFEPKENIEINVSAFSKISDLCVHITDSTGNDPLFEGLQQMKIEIFEPNGRKVYSKSDVKVSKSQAVLLYDFSDIPMAIGDTEDSPNVVIFICKVSYKRDREIIELPSATLKCCLIKFNNVVDLKLQAFQAGNIPSLSQYTTSQQACLDFRRDNNKYFLQMPCGTAAPILTLVLETDDGKPFIPELETFAVSAKRKVGKERTRISFMELFDCEIEEDNYRLLFIPTDEMKLNELCTYELDILYKEQRSTLMMLPDEKKSIKIQVFLTFVAAIPSKLSLDRLSFQKIQNRIVSDFADAKRRLIGENIRIHAMDMWGNISSFLSTHDVYCRIVSEAQEPLTTPHLFANGVECESVTGVMSIKHDECKFPRIEIAPTGGSVARIAKDGQYFLRFMLTEKSQPDPIDSLDIPFEFTSNASYSKQMNEIQSRLEPLNSLRAEYEQIMEKYNSCCNLFKKLQEGASPQIRSAQTHLETLCDLRLRREKEVEDMHNQVTQHRPPKRRQNHPDPVKLVGKDIMGQVVDLAAVEDPTEAQILSWACYHMIDAVVVNDTETALKLYDDKVKVMSIDQIVPFQVVDRTIDKKRLRNVEEMKSAQLDLQAILMPGPGGNKKMIKPQGNPRYMVNIISLDSENEHLRDSLFFNIFGNAILFDNFEHGLAYRKYLVKTRQKPPTIYTLSGEKIGSNALMDPSPAARKPSQLEFVFGEPKTKHIAEMNTINDLELLKEIITVVEEMAALKSQMSSMGIDSILAQISHLEEKQGQIQFSLSQKS